VDTHVALAGFPVIRSFTCNDAAHSLILIGNKTLVFSWLIEDADSVKIEVSTTLTGADARAVPRVPSDAVPNPAQGSLTIPASPLTSLFIWGARYTLTAKNRHGAVQEFIDVSAPSSNIALVCVGGGIRSSFDFGAVSFLRAFLPQAPKVFAGSGFGALTAVGAAASWTAPSPADLFWNNFQTPLDSLYAFGAPIYPDLFGSHADPRLFNSFYDRARAFADVVASGSTGQFTSAVSQPNVDSGAIFWSAVSTAAGLVKDAVKEGAAQALDSSASSLSWVAPVAVIVEVAVMFAVQFGIQKAHADLVRDVLSANAMVDHSPMWALIRRYFTGSLDDIRGNEAKLRIPLSNLEAGTAHYADEFGKLYPRGPSIGSGPAVITDAVTIETLLAASVSFPGWSAPVKIGDSHYVDGSLQDAAPIGAALDAGADSIIVLQPNQRSLQSATSFEGASMAAISTRADLMRVIGDVQAKVAPFDGWEGRAGAWKAPVTSIEATLSLFQLRAVDGDVGLKNIWAEYGYMRAFDVLAPEVIFGPEEQSLAADARQFLKQNSDLITALRYECWANECNLQGVSYVSYLPKIGPKPEITPVPDSTAAARIRAGKLQIRQALVDRLTHVQKISSGRPFPQPPAVAGVSHTVDMWFQNFEHHPWPFDAFIANPLTPWSALGGFPNGDVPAAATPDPLPVNLYRPA
jgi:predicted acylesterase/phospholipase RssA